MRLEKAFFHLGAYSGLCSFGVVCLVDPTDEMQVVHCSQTFPSDIVVRNLLRQYSSQATMPWDNFVIELKDAEFTEGSNAKLVAKTRLHGKEFMWFLPEVSWYRGEDDDEVPTGGRVQTRKNMEGLFELVFSPVTMDDQGVYTVRASYATAVVRETASLSVKRGCLANFSKLYFLHFTTI